MLKFTGQAKDGDQLEEHQHRDEAGGGSWSVVVTEKLPLSLCRSVFTDSIANRRASTGYGKIAEGSSETERRQPEDGIHRNTSVQ